MSMSPDDVLASDRILNVRRYELAFYITDPSNNLSAMDLILFLDSHTIPSVYTEMLSVGEYVSKISGRTIYVINAAERYASQSPHIRQWEKPIHILHC